ncbi:hypothetical protein QYE76_033136 [Lolium multiflorum]|uniref:Uncharacterized protein n=1 Tax=Lolium multiflorum TaxID=4521 RepID=A0AAD8QYJ3_LOLMU|nr:hypothetical protein QYE76_033136 [Lolium multiflorum]
MAAVDLGTAEWERSKITNQDINLLKKLGISKKPKAVCFPSEESYPTPPMGYRPMMKELFRIGAQFIGYRDYASKTEEKLAEVNERANTLAQKLEQSEEARKKAESDAVQARREADKAKADAAGKTSQEFELEDPDNDPLLDAVSFLEFHGTEAREGIDQAKAGLSRLFPYFFPKKEEPATFLALAKCFNPPEDLGLKMRQENKVLLKALLPWSLIVNKLLTGRKWATRSR